MKSGVHASQSATGALRHPTETSYRNENGAAPKPYTEDEIGWRERSRIVLTPIAAPSIMGLTGFMLATLMVGAWQAGWYGNADTPLSLWPFALVAGGVLQSIAAVMSFKARDGMAVAVHTAWGAFWIGWGIFQLLVATHVQPAVPLSTSNPAFAFWFIGLTLVTFTCMIGAMASNAAITLTLAALTGGAGITAAGFWAGSVGTLHVGGWFFVISAGLAWLAVSAMVLEHSFGRTILPSAKWEKAANIPGRKAVDPIAYSQGGPGLRVGQ
jgi:succinate-acetate transporter protein